MPRVLTCPAGCAERRFEALNAPLYVDSAGRYLSHDASRAAYVCAACRGVAVDLGEAMREAETERTGTPRTLVCPGCGTEMLPPEDDPDAETVECPVCDTRFSVDEGSPRLLGGSTDRDPLGDLGGLEPPFRRHLDN